MTATTEDKPALQSLNDIRDMATELEGITTALDLLLENVPDSKGCRLAAWALSSLTGTKSHALAMALDEYTTLNPD